MRIMNERFCGVSPRPPHSERIREMARLDIQDSSDNFPFRVVVNVPDPYEIPHAHIIAIDAKQTEMGTFVLTINPPRRVEDFVEYKAGPHKGLRDTPIEWLEMIIKWAKKPNVYYRRFGFACSNWKAFFVAYGRNKKK